MASGYMTDGVGNRCPVRYKMVNDTEAKIPIITVMGIRVNSEDDMCSRIQQRMKQLHANNEFRCVVLNISHFFYLFVCVCVCVCVCMCVFANENM